VAAAAATGPGAATTASCSGSAVKIFDNSNGGGVLNGAKPPTFSTKGTTYCLTQVVTYHWNNGHGQTPGSVGIAGAAMSASATARGSPGQGGAPNVNWTGTFTRQVTIDGTDTCTDSDPKTWSQNPQSGGKGFCVVYGKAVTSGGRGGATTTTKVKPGINTKVGPVAITGGGKTGSKGGLAIRATPDSGKPPLAVTFALSSPKVVQWRVDFGDGLFRTGFGRPPAALAHTYARNGDFRPTPTVLSAQNAAPQSAATSVSVAASPLLGLVANPTSGSPPLAVAFTVSTSVQNVTSWAIDFGDGSRAAGAGTPPSTL
jgi:hypothetical protein